MIHEKVTATVVEKEFVKFHAFDQIAQSLGFERRYMRVADFPVPRPRRKHKQKKKKDKALDEISAKIKRVRYTYE